MSKEIYAKIIADAFPKALVEFSSNWDDYHYGWEITPCSGVVLRLLVCLDDEMSIILEKYVMVMYNKTISYKRIFDGGIPANKEYEPDFDFIEGILRNYERF